jgi:hypothetical protein
MSCLGRRVRLAAWRYGEVGFKGSTGTWFRSAWGTIFQGAWRANPRALPSHRMSQGPQLSRSPDCLELIYKRTALVPGKRVASSPRFQGDLASRPRREGLGAVSVAGFRDLSQSIATARSVHAESRWRSQVGKATRSPVGLDDLVPWFLIRPRRQGIKVPGDHAVLVHHGPWRHGFKRLSCQVAVSPRWQVKSINGSLGDLASSNQGAKVYRQPGIEAISSMVARVTKTSSGLQLIDK